MLCYISDSGFQYDPCLLVHVSSVCKSDICKCDASFSVPSYFSVRRRNAGLSQFLPDKSGAPRHVDRFIWRKYENVLISEGPSTAGTIHFPVLQVQSSPEASVPKRQ